MSAIVQDPNSGEILAMASYPSFNPGEQSTWKHLKNSIICDFYEPGSTFKSITAAAALEEKAVKRTDVIFCENGKYRVYDHVIKDHEKKGNITFDEVIAYSSNIGTAKVAEKLGKQKLYEYIRKFGFYNNTGIDLPGESKGLLQKPERWSGLSLSSISFGQEIGVTAMQMVNAYSAIANGGNLLEPKIIKKIQTSEGKTVYNSQKRVIRKTVSKNSARNLREMLEKVVSEGTGKSAGVKGYSVGGKTGTAQKADKEKGGYLEHTYIASFCGFIPAKNPSLTIIVVVDEPQGKQYYASEVAAPVFKNIASRAVSYLKILPDKEEIQLAYALR